MDWNPGPSRMVISVGSIVMALVAVAMWIVLGKLAVTREFRAVFLQDTPGGQWSLHWSAPPARRGAPERDNGAWLDLNAMIGPETLEIIPSGTPTIPGRRFHLWLYEVRPLTTSRSEPSKPADLKGLLRSAPPGALHGSWVNFDRGDGIVYNGNTPGYLRIDLPAGGVSLDFAKTEDGGPVTFRYGGQEQTIDVYGTQQNKTVLTLKRSETPADMRMPVVMRLPGYAMRSLELRAAGMRTGTLTTLSDPRIETRVLGLVVHSQRVASDGGEGSGGARSVRLEAADSGDTVLPLPTPAPMPILGHVVGVGIFVAVLLAACFVAWVIAGIARRGPPRWATFDRCAVASVVLVRAWMAWWSPFCYCPDSVDYMLGTKKFVQTGSLEHFTGMRVPGYAVFLAPAWRYFDDFNLAAMLMQAAVGVWTALLCREIAARFMPRPWPTLVLLAAGLSPTLIAWEHFAMSESLGAFLIVFVCWAALRPGAWEARNGMTAAVLYAALIGIACAGAALVRGNLQLLLIVVPVLVMAETWRRFGPARSLVFAAVVVMAGGACLTPRVLRTQREYGVPALILGGGWMRGLLSYRNGTLDENQAAAFDPATVVEIREQRLSERLGDYQFAERYVATSKRIPVKPGTHPSLVEDHKMEFLAGESFSRRPDRRVMAALEAFLNVLGVWTFENTDGFHESEYFTRPARGVIIRTKTNYWANATNWPGNADIAALCERTEVDITHLKDNASAIAFDRFFRAEIAFRPVWGFFLIIGVLAAAWRRDVRMLCLAALVGGNAFALAWVVQCGIDRYGVPMEPLLRIVALFGVWRTFEWISRARLSRRTPGRAARG